MSQYHIVRRTAALSVLCAMVALGARAEEWVAWNPVPDKFEFSPIDLRTLNEDYAGEHGRILVSGEQFVFESTGQPVRFWGVNGPPEELEGEELKFSLRQLAKHGVNLIRIHGSISDEKTGELREDTVAHKHTVIRAAKTHGIYSLLSIYFPIWFKPENGPGWREGYDGKRTPFGLLYFEPEFQQVYRNWWRKVLTTPDSSGHRLLDDPALLGLEIVNEDSLFFWTFNYEAIPDPQMRKLERRFAKWVNCRYGSLEKAFATWHDISHPRDNLADHRLGFRSLYDISTQRTPRDRDTATFLYEVQREFYRDILSFLRDELGYRGLITASNWVTADDTILGPIEKLTYIDGDFIDRHGYFDTNHKGENAAWCILPGHTYSDISGLRFDNPEPALPRRFSNPVMDPMYNFKPSMISETTWNRPNRHRGEAPIMYATYGALQDSDSIIHFAYDGFKWQVKNHLWMQPWTLMAPTQIGQFPATALMYRRNLIRTGDLMADVPLKISDALALHGTPLIQAVNLDELRKGDIVAIATDSKESNTTKARPIDPLIHFTGRTNVHLSESGTPAVLRNVDSLINHTEMTVVSVTGELKLDYGRGFLRIDAPSVQGLSGNLRGAGSVELTDVRISSPLEVGHILVVALDGRPLASSMRMLVQTMTEEKPSGFATKPTNAAGVNRIESLGTDPWLIRAIQGHISFKRRDAELLRVTALDFNGYPVETIGTAASLTLRPDRAYYIIEP